MRRLVSKLTSSHIRFRLHGSLSMQNKSPQLQHATKRTYSEVSIQFSESPELPVPVEKISAMASCALFISVLLNV